MKLFVAFFLLVSFTCSAQEQNALIMFVQDQDTFPDCITEYAVNGLYSVQPIPLTDLKIPGTLLVRPIDDSDHQILFTFANQASMSALGSFEIPAPYYVPRSKEEMDSILRRKDPNYDSYYLSSPSYLFQHGFVKTPLEMTETQREDERTKRLLEEQEKAKNEINRNIEPNFYNYRNSYPQVMDGIYIRESGWMQEYPFYAAHPEIKDSVEQAHQKIREDLKPVIDSILQPFYFSISEVTNKEYREFVEYVRDSIAVFMAYREVEDELASTLLNVSKKELKSLDLYERDTNMNKYGWRIPENFYTNHEFLPYIQEIFYPQFARYYKRREFDTRKFKYKLNDSNFVSVYPDTLGFKAIELDSSQFLTNLYFWHPAFDDYPVVNVSYNQMLAFCHWKELQINKVRPSDSLWIHVSPPSIRQYEFALKHSLPEGLKHKAHDNLISHFVTFERLEAAPTHFLTSVTGVNKLHKRDKNKELSQYEEEYTRWKTANKNDIFYFLNGNVSEMVVDQPRQEELNDFRGTSEKTLLKLHYVIGSNYHTDVKVLGDDQYNALFYKTIQEITKSNCTTGFRLVYTLEKR